MQMSEAEQKELAMHIREHMSYPASKAQIVEACNYMAHVPKATVEWFEKTLPERSYTNAEEVIHAVGLEHSH